MDVTNNSLFHRRPRNSYAPTASPTKSPWSETAFLTFLYGENNNADGETSGNDPSSGSSSNNNDMLASQVNDGLENFNELQFHFYCGFSWDHGENYLFHAFRVRTDLKQKIHSFVVHSTSRSFRHYPYQRMKLATNSVLPAIEANVPMEWIVIQTPSAMEEILPRQPSAPHQPSVVLP